MARDSALDRLGIIRPDASRSIVLVIVSGQGRNRTADTQIFSLLLYQLSYLAVF
jgi:hypothetical protein